MSIHQTQFKFIEKWGTGTIEMVRKCVAWGLPEPEFEFTGTSLIVTFRKSVFSRELLEQMGLNERQIGAVEFLGKYKKISTKEYCKLFNIARDTANRDLNMLQNKAIIERKGSGPQTYYTLSKISIGQYRAVRLTQALAANKVLYS